MVPVKPLLLLLTLICHIIIDSLLCVPFIIIKWTKWVSEEVSKRMWVSERTHERHERRERTSHFSWFICSSYVPRTHRSAPTATLFPTHQVCSPCSLPWFRGYLIIRNEVNQWERWFNLFPLLVHFPCCRSHRSHSFTPPLLIRRVNQHERWNVTTRWTQLIHWDRGDGNSNTSQWMTEPC